VTGFIGNPDANRRIDSVFFCQIAAGQLKRIMGIYLPDVDARIGKLGFRKTGYEQQGCNGCK